MVGIQIPNLVMAHSDGGQSKPVKFGDYLIPELFRSLFRFQDGGKTWSADFTIKISEHGTPKLMSVEVRGSQKKHPKPLTKTWNANNMDELIERFRNPQKSAPTWSSEEFDEFIRLSPEPESVERWQLKIVEQYRFQLMELGIKLAIDLGNPMKMKGADGAYRLVYMPREEPLTAPEIKKLLKEIDQKIRQKITPDFLEGVARIYTEAGLRGERPIKAVQEFYKCSYRTAQDYATKARELKLLPETTPGKVTVRKPRARKEKK